MQQDGGTRAPAHPHRARGLAYAAATALLWGVLAIALKFSLSVADVETIVWFRFASAFLMLTALLALRRPAHLRILRRPPWLALLAALLLAANYRFYFKGLELAGASSAQVLIQSAPMLLALIGVTVFREPLLRSQRLGFVVAIAGLALFYRDQASGSAAPPSYAKGVAAIFVGAATWAAWAALQKVLVARGHAPQALNALTYGVSALLFLPFVTWPTFASVSPGGWLLLVFLGANTLLAYGAIGEALRDAPANQVSIIITLNPLITLGLLALLAHLEASWIAPEPIAWIGYAGAALMVLGVMLVVRKRA